MKSSIEWAMAKIECKGLLFDLDGVLVDSTPAVARAWYAWAARHGFVAEDVVRKAHGRPSMTTIKELLPHGDHEAENRVMEQCEISDVKDVVALPGATELVESLPPGRWTIVTSCTRPLAKVRISAGGLPVPQQLVTSSDVKKGKPDPEPYLAGAARLQLAPEDCVVVEDAPAGIRAGKAAGMRVLALRTTAPDAELTQAGADWIITDLASLTVEQPSSDGWLRLTLGT
jgi:mannitol-1-/sugar-/sorbitol-6-phosphatase